MLVNSPLLSRTGLKTEPFGSERIAFCLGLHRKGLDVTFPMEIAERIRGHLLSGSNRKPCIFFSGFGFSHAQIQLIQVPRSSKLTLVWIHPHASLVISRSKPTDPGL